MPYLSQIDIPVTYRDTERTTLRQTDRQIVIFGVSTRPRRSVRWDLSYWTYWKGLMLNYQNDYELSYG